MKAFPGLWLILLSMGQSVLAQGRVVQAGQFAGASLGEKIRAADVALGAGSGVIRVDVPGVIAAAVTIGPQHVLEVMAPVTLSAAIHLSSGSAVRCGGEAAVITSTLPYNGAMVQPVDGADGVVIEGCVVRSNHNYFVLLPTGVHVTNFRMLNNYGHSTNMFFQSNGPAVPPSRNLLFEGNTVSYPEPDKQQGEGGIVLAGAARDLRAVGNHFAGGGHGIQLFGVDAASYPDLAKILAANMGNATFTGNSCEHVTGACIWGSGMNAVVIGGNVADGCGDVCFDAEGSANVLIEGNVAQGCAAGCFAQFFSAYGNAIRGNTGISAGSPIVLFKNADPGVPQHQQNTAVSGNTLTCTGPAVCPAIYLESNYATTIDGNTIVNGSIVSPNESPLASVRNNVMSFSVAAGSAGLAVPNQVDGGISQISGNLIRSTFAQAAAVPCLLSVSSGYSLADTYVIENNVCSGFGATDLEMTNAGGNAGVPTFWTVRGNFFPHLSMVVGGTNHATGFNHSGNCSAASCEGVVAAK